MAFNLKPPLDGTEETKLVRLLQLWSAGEITLDAIRTRTKRSQKTIYDLIAKHKISRPPKFSY